MILTIVGARPQFVKAAVVSKAFSEAGVEEEIIHTGQHYDYEMSTVFWEELGLPTPSVNLEVGSGSHGKQTGIMLQKLEDFILDLPEKPQALLVYGDTNSTLAGAIVASKLHIPVVHVEAGLRSFNRNMPEEINRILTDHASDFLFCSSEEGVTQLAKEGITKQVYNVGDVMYDALLTFSEIADKKFNLQDIIPFEADSYYLATIHRPSNTDNDANLTSILQAFGELSKPVVWPVHPRNKERLKTVSIPKNLHLIDPVSYFKMMVLLKNSFKVITDSGGLQKEAYWMKKPCITVRGETEWKETLQGNWNILTGPNQQKILKASTDSPNTTWKPLYGEANATNKIAKILKATGIV
ncbi:non-hydrolyzing UDP-N-acetylglucosamine 2-epimerase [Gracilimonas tropica]|uniref:non-hydrolyzing UDP-N-acetylglucosamine 2-epimerase n=1 Tax=Gracilimonas tropica TaxID=454600 RepID=UPI000369B0E8|nr:UDP-N-acetylglucosamine 2-epimerase (non-hydrolyzing) [Gracilimonas tropica]